MREQFRFEKLKVWQDSILISKSLFIIAEDLHKNKSFSLSNQLFRASLSVCTNIAEGSGSASKKEFAQFLNISHRSAFECVNLLHVVEIMGAISSHEKEKLILELDAICRQLNSFRKHLLGN